MLVHKKQEAYVYEQEAARPAPPPKAKAVPKADTGLRVKCLIIVMVAAVMAAVTTMQSAAIVQAGYELVKVKDQAAKVERENELLRIDIAKLKSPQRIEEIAVRQLGMVMPKNAYFASPVLPAVSPAEGAPAEDTGFAGSIANMLKASKVEASKGQ